ncbi:MAG: Pyridinium-3,5-bisthiocarboxylic acid mononucleotide nickel insertion protein [Gemmatimonadaceae bacterium]|nr:Pyridinium-3,5-bisthiocarboxylic acid mononucleotide nickel insertion protein [Gemmatimonadaceae bacterium]
MRVAILDPFSGISGDMTLGALLDVGLDPEWLKQLPAELGLEGVGVRIARTRRSDISAFKVDFDIPPQPHGRHLRQIREVVSRSPAPEQVRELADRAFTAIASVEAGIHGIAIERVHLHEVGAVDAILDVVGSIWGLSELGVSRVYCSTISLGDGFVNAAHGRLPVPAPATLRLLEGHLVRPGPDGSGELVTPTGAALVQVLSSGPPPAEFIPRASGYGAGTKDFVGRPNVLRIVLADEVSVASVASEPLVQLATDVDDMSAELLAGAADTLRQAGALDVVLLSTQMKKGRVGTRLEVLARPADVERLEVLLFTHTSTLGVRRMRVERRALSRASTKVQVLGHDVRMKVAALPDGSRRAKPEFDDVWAVSTATGRSPKEVTSLALAAAERA